MPIQNSDYIQVQSASTQYKTTATLFRSDNKSYDFFTVNRSGTNYRQFRADRYQVDYSDTILVNRSNVNYKISGEEYFNYMWQYIQSPLNKFSYSIPPGAGKDRYVSSFEDVNGTSDVELYNYSGSTIQLLTPPVMSPFNTAYGFGTANAISDEYSQVYIGVPEYPSGGVSGNDTEGGVCVFNLAGTTITQILTASDPQRNARFGCSVAVGSDRMVVGARAWGNFSVGPYNGGAAYLYSRSGTTWNFVTKFTPTNIDEDDNFGWAATITGNSKLVVSSPGKDISIGGEGCIYVFDINAGSQFQISNPDSGGTIGISANFGNSIDSDGDLIIVGAPGTRNVSDDRFVGAAHLYKTDGTYLGRLAPPTQDGSQYFGASVSIGCGRIVVGSPSRGDFGDAPPAPYDNGSVYVYDYNLNLKQTIQRSPAFSGSKFGANVSITPNGTFLVQSPSTAPTVSSQLFLFN